MAWTPTLDLPREIRPGQRRRGVGVLKRALIRVIIREGHPKVSVDRQIVAHLHPRSNHYNAATVKAVKVLQKRKRLKVDGVVGPATWRALGFADADLMPASLRGIPYPPDGGVRPLDGNWIALPLWNVLASARKAGKSFSANSGWRPDWYQKILFDAAVRKYGSEQAAAKWVARPGTSKHRFKDARGAVDVNNASTLYGYRGLYQPMSWEPWHLQLRTASGILRKLTSLVAGDDPVTLEPPSGVDLAEIEELVLHDLAICEARQNEHE